MVKIVDKDFTVSNWIQIFKILPICQYDGIAQMVERQANFAFLLSSSLRRATKICASSSQIAGNITEIEFQASVIRPIRPIDRDIWGI